MPWKFKPDLTQSNQFKGMEPRSATAFQHLLSSLFPPLLSSTATMFFFEDNHMEAYTSMTVPTDQRWKPHVELAPNCPRCDSSNTKFCYYNNYSLAQPRYFCKGCRRYWTKGGSLRNVPIGGGCRKNRRGKSVRLSNDSGMTTTSSARSSMPHSSSQMLGSVLRPDLALDDMFDNCKRSQPSKEPAIDMAVMYARYMNQVPDVAAEVEDSFELSRATETAEVSTPSSAERKQGLVGSDHGLSLSTVETGFSADPRSLEHTPMPTVCNEILVDDGVVFSMNWPACPSLPWSPPEQIHGVSTSVQEVGASRHHYQDLMFGDWSVIDHSRFEAF